MILPILKYNKKNIKILRKKSKNIIYYNKKKKEKIKILIKKMFKTMYFYNGIGLAAPQIGKNIKLFVIGFKHIKISFINPKILLYSKKKIYSQESCLSLPNKNIKIKRFKFLKIEYIDNQWKKQKIKIYNMLSIIFQHEYDHLYGKLIIDYL